MLQIIFVSISSSFTRTEFFSLSSSDSKSFSLFDLSPVISILRFFPTSETNFLKIFFAKKNKISRGFNLFFSSAAKIWLSMSRYSLIKFRTVVSAAFAVSSSRKFFFRSSSSSLSFSFSSWKWLIFMLISKIWHIYMYLTKYRHNYTLISVSHCLEFRQFFLGNFTIRRQFSNLVDFPVDS